MIDYDARYEMCAHCEHFIMDNPSWTPERPYAVTLFLHLDDGEKEHDHDAVPSEHDLTLGEWMYQRPDLFTEWTDGKIGPNSSKQGIVEGQLSMF